MVIELFAVGCTESGKDFRQFTGTEKSIHLRHLILEFMAVELAEAAHHIDSLDFPLTFFVDGGKNFSDGLLLGIFDESASVDKNGVGFVGGLGKVRT